MASLRAGTLLTAMSLLATACFANPDSDGAGPLGLMDSPCDEATLCVAHVVAPGVAIRTVEVGLETETETETETDVDVDVDVEALLPQSADGEHFEVVKPIDAKRFELTLEQVGGDRYDLVIVDGAEDGSSEAAVIAAARRDAATTFVLIDSETAISANDREQLPPNLITIQTNTVAAGFLAGAAAGLLTETGTLGAVLATDLAPGIAGYRQGFERGARAVNPAVSFLTVFHPGDRSEAFGDPHWGASTARDVIADGADVMFAAGGTTGAAALVESARSDGATWCIGAGTDAWDSVAEAQRCLFVSVVFDLEHAVAELIEVVRAGDSPPRILAAPLALSMVRHEAAKGEIVQQLDEIHAGIVDGSIDPSTP